MKNEIKFFTATILYWKKLLYPDKYKQIIINSMKFLVDDKRVWIYGFVIMPNHLHILWRMQESFEEKNVQRDFLKFTAQKIKFDLLENHPQVLPHFKSTQNDREYQFWERRAYSSTIYNRLVFEQKLNYIHNNPLVGKWKLAESAELYFYSSAKYYLAGDSNFSFLTHYTEHI
ncbi:MAG: transposase [Bacteroidetes bacterium]|nr:transposase [Bacteroidota bacterium]